MNHPRSLGELLAANPVLTPRGLALREMRNIDAKRKLAADIARQVFALDAAKARFDREQTTEAEEEMHQHARYLLRMQATAEALP